MTEPHPVRLRLSRNKGFDLQAASRAANGLDVAKVARPSMFGNPFKVSDAVEVHQATGAPIPGETPRETAVRWHKEWLAGIRALPITPPSTAIIKHMLRGKNLACWCKPCDPCHADVLPEIANR